MFSPKGKRKSRNDLSNASSYATPLHRPGTGVLKGYTIVASSLGAVKKEPNMLLNLLEAQ